MRVAAADRLTRDFGDGHWSAHTTEDSVLRDMKRAHVIVARVGDDVVGTLTLQTRKPWSIDLDSFTPCPKPLYLVNMAVTPDRQRSGVGRALLVDALQQARASSANTIRLDAYEGPAGAGEFYRKCGYTPVGGQSYKGVPLLYFELMTGVRA